MAIKTKNMTQCTKCGNKEINIQYKHVDEKVYWIEHKQIKNISRFCRNDTYYSSDNIEKECLVYTCETCGYKEAKEPLNL